MYEGSFHCLCLSAKWPNLHNIFKIMDVTGLGLEDSYSSKASLEALYVLETPTVPQGLKT